MLTRKTPLKPGTKGLRRTPMKPGTKPLARSSTLARSVVQLRSAKPASTTRKKPGRGLKGRAPTAAEKRFMDLAGQQPCMACEIDGRLNHAIILHHVDGRTKPGAHFRVLPICAPHHQQDDSDQLQRLSVHGRKASFVARYGTEAELLAKLYARLGFIPVE